MKNWLLKRKSLISTIDHTNQQPIPVNKFTSKSIKISHINIRLNNNKVLDFQQYITSNLIDICAISETWIKSNADTNTIKEIAPQEYKMISQPCKSGEQGSGLALLYKESISVKKTSDDKTNFETMEISTFDIKFAGTVINLYLIYRLPVTTVLQFCSDMTDIMQRRISKDLGKLLLIGDFGVHRWTYWTTYHHIPRLPQQFQSHQSCSMAKAQIRTHFRFTYQQPRWHIHKVSYQRIHVIWSHLHRFNNRSTTWQTYHQAYQMQEVQRHQQRSVLWWHSWEPIITTHTKWTNYAIRYGGYIK